jgi:hypothetical protein
MKNQAPQSAPSKLLPALTLNTTLTQQVRSYIHHCRMIQQHSLSDYYKKREIKSAWEKVNPFYYGLLRNQHSLADLIINVLLLRNVLKEILPHHYNISYDKSFNDYSNIISICETLRKK